MKILGSHMLEVSEQIAAENEQPHLEVHPLSIGGKADPVRLVFDARTGPAVAVTIVDMGNRFRMVVNEVDAVPMDQPLPKLPVARALWLPRPDLKTATTAWILAGGAHHTGFSYALSTWKTSRRWQASSFCSSTMTRRSPPSRKRSTGTRCTICWPMG